MNDKPLSPYQQWKQNLGETRVWDMFNPNIEKVSDEVQKTRFDICKSCEFLTPITNQCTKCGCFMHLKTTLPKAECPIHKWGKEEAAA